MPQSIPFRHRPIADYGALGDGRSIALVSSEGSIDWWCPGRFDAPTLFGHLLDRQKGGQLTLRPAVPGASSQAYVEDTNVLVTRHANAQGAVEVTDFLVYGDDSGTEGSVLVRRIRGLEGRVDMATTFTPRFQYGRVQPRFERQPASSGRLLVHGAGQAVVIEAPLTWTRSSPGERRAAFTIAAGETVDLVLRHTSYDSPEPFAPLPHDAAELERRTLHRWRSWASRIAFTGPDAAAVRRAALAVKLLQFEPTGAFVAAGTASLPEEVGGARNWDYRFTWLRDGAWSAHALGKLGFHDDEQRFRGWISEVVSTSGLPLRVLYTINGTSDTHERELDHLEGYRDSRPVRIGNGARDQHQLDTYGEVVEFLLREPGAPSPETWACVHRIVDWVADSWREPDSGIWEMRSEPRHFVLSKAMAWVALARAADVAEQHGLEGDVARWRAEAATVREEILTRGYDARRGSFLQAYDFPHLDASNLLLPMIGFIDATDPRMVATVDATMRELTVDGLVYRYIDAGDGVPGGEATFAYCTFWLIEVLAAQGRTGLARSLFDGMLARATPLGLFAEEIELKTGEHLGNYPQAFPHIGLIEAALALERANAPRQGTVTANVTPRRHAG